MSTGARSTVTSREPTRPGDGSSRRWSRTIGDWRYSFTLVNMPSGEVRWFVNRYDTPISEWADRASYTNEQARQQFSCYWRRYREWTFKSKPTNISHG